MTDSPITVALAILDSGDRYNADAGRFLMQLRDNIPGIPYPGHWGLFGGHLEATETPEVALEREIWEELNYQIIDYHKFRCYKDNRVIRYVFQAPLKIAVDRLILGEGWDLKLLSLEEIYSGYSYSDKAQDNRPIGKIHQQILLDFVNWQNRADETK